MPRRNDIQKIQCAVISMLFGIWFAGVSSVVGMAQVDCVMPNKLTVSSVQGQVFDPTGVPIPGALISFMTNGASVLQVKTNEEGRFRIDNASGLHTVKAEAPMFEMAMIELNVGRDAQSLLHPTNLSVVLGLNGLFCPWVTTSKKKFEQEILANKKRIQEAAKNNATKK